MNAIPRPTDITAAWLTEQLRAAGFAQTTVAHFTARDVGTGQVGRCIRFGLTLAPGADDAAPTSLVGKFTSDDPISRETGRALATYATETRFYQHIAPRLNIRVPRCYYADIDEAGLYHLILMEDLAPAEQGDQIGGCTPAIAREAVRQLIGLHAPTWRDASWFDLLGRVEDGPFADTKGLYTQSLAGFTERYSSALAPEHMAVVQSIGAAADCPMFNLRGDNFALEHYDYRLDNVLIDASVEPAQVTAVDWQSVRVGKPLNDVAYFLGSALEPEVRADVEMDILRMYHDGLIAGGVSDYTWDECFTDYRKGVFAGFAVSVISPVMVAQTERGDRMFTTMTRRYAQMAIDLDIDEFIA